MNTTSNFYIKRTFLANIKKISFLTIFFINLLLPLYAINGHITSNTSWNENISITGDLWIDENVTLTIAAGVTVTIPKIDQNADTIGDIDLFVSGRVICLGTEINKVIFKSLETEPGHKDWAGITFNSGSTQSQSNLTHVEIHNANRPIHINGVGLQANNLKILNSEEYGIRIQSTLNMTRFTNTIIENTNGNGMLIESGSVNMTDLSIGNSSGFGMKALAPVTLNATRVNIARSILNGLWLAETQSVIFNDSKFNSNHANGIYIKNMSPTFNNCQINNNIGAGVRIESTSGVPTFTNCTIANNKFGVNISGVPAVLTYCNIENNRYGGISVNRSQPSISYSNITNNGYEENSFSYNTVDEYEWRTTSGAVVLPENLYLKINPSGAPMQLDRLTYKKDGDNFYYGSSGVRYYRNYTRIQANGIYYLLDEYLTSSSYLNHDMPTITLSGEINESLVNRNNLALNLYQVENCPGARAWVTNLKYHFDFVISIDNLAGTTAYFQNNWWGQITGVDGLVNQVIPNTVNYEGVMVSRIVEAGCNLINTPATISVTSPATLEINPTSTTIAWIAGDYDNDASISLFYNSVNDTNGTLIVANLSEDSDFSYEWDFTDTPYGKYYIYAVIDDGINPPVVSFAPGQVMVGELKIVIDDYYASAGDTISVAIQALNAYQNFDLNAFQITIGFTPSLLTYLSIETEGCLTEDWTVNSNGQIMGEVAVNGFSVANLNGSGDLFQLKFLVNDAGADLQNTDLTINNFQYNNGLPEPTIVSGLFTLRNVYDITGWTNYYSNNQAIPDVDILAEGYSTGNNTSNSAGEFSFSDYFYGNYFLTASYVGELPELLISPLDASMVARYALGLINLDGNQIVAGNVDGDGDVDIYDAATIARYSVGLVEEFPAGLMVFTPPTHSFLLSPAFTPRTFMGIALGDVSGNWTNAREDWFTDGVTYDLEEDDEYLFVNINYNNEFFSLAARINYAESGLEFVDYTSHITQNSLSTFTNAENGCLRLAAYSVVPLSESQVMTLKFRKLGLFNENSLQVASLIFDENNGAITQNDNDVSQVNSKLYQNYPNPFNPSTSINFFNQKQQNVKIDIYNLKGQKVSTLLNDNMNSGLHTLTWNAQNVSSGIYFAKIRMADGYNETIKMVLMK